MPTEQGEGSGGASALLRPRKATGLRAGPFRGWSRKSGAGSLRDYRAAEGMGHP